MRPNITALDNVDPRLGIDVMATWQEHHSDCHKGLCHHADCLANFKRRARNEQRRTSHPVVLNRPAHG